VEIIVTIVSDTLALMNTLTAMIDLNVLPVQYTVLSAPTSTVLVSGRGVVNTIMSGFTVDSVIYIAATNSWEIDCRYVANIPNTLTSPFISRVGAPPYSDEVSATFEISKFPCKTELPSVCCLLDYRDDYSTGSFANNITESIGVCDSTVQQQNTNGLFDASTTGFLITSLLDQYSQSSVQLMAEDGFRLTLGMNDVANHFSKRLDFDDGHYELKLFVGMAYLTLMNSPVILTLYLTLYIICDFLTLYIICD
jgi:hypothetical protein